MASSLDRGSSLLMAFLPIKGRGRMVPAVLLTNGGLCRMVAVGPRTLGRSRPGGFGSVGLFVHPHHDPGAVGKTVYGGISGTGG